MCFKHLSALKIFWVEEPDGEVHLHYTRKMCCRDNRSAGRTGLFYSSTRRCSSHERRTRKGPGSSDGKSFGVNDRGGQKGQPSSFRRSTCVDDAPLETPVEEEFQVGAISLAWNEENALVSIELYELDNDEDQAQGKVLEINISLGMASAFVQRSRALVNAGRLPCPFCGIPIDPRGHLCPRANGYRR